MSPSVEPAGIESLFRRSENRFGEKNRLEEMAAREFLSIGRFRPIGKRASRPPSRDAHF
jgi:hypothetical protein